MDVDLGVPGFNPSSAFADLVPSRWHLPWAHILQQNEGNSLDQHSPIELSALMEIVSVLFSRVVTSHMWLLHTSDVACMIKELNFKLYFILINLNSHMLLMVTILDSRVLVSLSLSKHLSTYNLPSIWLHVSHHDVFASKGLTWRKAK